MRGEAIKRLKKLRGRSLGELRVRGSQSLRALAERCGFSAQTRVPTDAAFFEQIDLGGWRSKDSLRRPRSAEELLAHFRSRRAPRFFASLDDRAGAATDWRELFKGDYEKSLVEHAERIVAGRFDLLGLRDLSFGDEIDWHFEPVSGRRAPLAHWSRIDYLNAEVAGDKKVTWELNRHQHFMTLGRAYVVTGDERYAETFAAHLSSWMEANPPKQGINWASSLEVSFRAISWLWALHFFRDSPHLSPELFARALKFLRVHARHLETYLSTYFSPNTHLTGEALGLFYLGTLLPELSGAARWRETGGRVLVAQLARQVRADGTYFEQASYYQRYTADFYTHFLLLSLANGESVESHVERKLSALLDHLLHVTRPDGTTPLYGEKRGARRTTSAPRSLRARHSSRAPITSSSRAHSRKRLSG
ncbi:MAG: alginate lyase family protein [Acidobacteria bacterium]|nr:alginate lyase family protein [Acidobacteriota bacterium]